MNKFVTLYVFILIMSACGSADSLFEDLEEFNSIDSLLANPPSPNDSTNNVPSDTIKVEDDSLHINSPKLQSEKYIIAHRGYWNNGQGIPQNSRASLKKALGLRIYGTEFDVHQTKDNVLVVNHDAKFNNISISNSTYKDLSQTSLTNGESIPKLEEFFIIWKESQTSVKLIIELKSCNVRDVIALVEKYELQDHVVYISFSKTYCKQLAEMGLGHITNYLGGDMTPLEIKNFGVGGIDYQSNVFNNHPNYIEEAKALGLSVIVWTVNSTSIIKDYVSKKVIVTTDNPSEF